MFARPAFALLIALALMQFSSTQAEELERLPGLTETEPVVQLEKFADDPASSAAGSKAIADGWPKAP